MKAAGVLPVNRLHHADHLAVACILMDIPLHFHSDRDLHICQGLYPELQVTNQPFFFKDYDVFFSSEPKNYERFKLKHGTSIRHVAVPHGFSDKVSYLKQYRDDDITLSYSSYFNEVSGLERAVVTGNLRLQYYQKHRSFFDELVQREVASRFAKRQTTILYAPTWHGLEGGSSFFEGFHTVVNALPGKYNLLIKPHPALEEEVPEAYDALLSEAEGRGNVVVLEDFPLIYPILQYVDIYVGDHSAVGYDWLSFQKPMFFLIGYAHDIEKTVLRGCGWQVTDFSKLYEVIEKALPVDQERYGFVRQQLYDKAFALPKSWSELKTAILLSVVKKM